MRSKEGIALIVANGFFLAVLFPYLSPVPTPYDTQPWALALSLLIITMFLGSGRFALPCPLWALLIPFLYAAMIFPFHRGPLLGAVRSLAGYASVFCIAAAAYLTARWLRPKLFLNAVFIWAVVGVIQLTVYKEFGSQLVPRLSTSGVRGVTSLAVEPSYYAVTAVFFLLLNELFYTYQCYNRVRYLVLALLISIQILWTSSGLGFFLLLIFVLLKSLISLLAYSRRWFLLRPIAVAGGGVGLAIMLGGFVFASQRIFAGYRLGNLLRLILENPTRVISIDDSLADRLAHVVLSFYGFFQSYGMGFGLATWGEHAYQLGESMGGDLWQAFLRGMMITGTVYSDRIMSGWGSALFELGVLGLVIILAVTWVLVHGIRKDEGHRSFCWLALGLVHAIMIQSVPLGFPLFPFIIGVCAASQLGRAAWCGSGIIPATGAQPTVHKDGPCAQIPPGTSGKRRTR